MRQNSINMKHFLSIFISLAISLVSVSQGSGNLLEFNGSSTALNCGSINMGGSALTLQGWVKVDAFKTASPYISSLWGTELGNNSAFIRLGDGGLAANKAQFVLLIGGRQTKLDGIKTLKANQWYHIAATYDGTDMKLYIDGILDASKSQTGSVTSNSTFGIGQFYNASRTLDGQIDEVSVFKTALSQSTIRNWMCQSIKTSHPNYANLEGYWKLDEGTGTTTTDNSTKTHNGTFSGSVQWKVSSAPIGDTSVADYTVPLNLKLMHADGDSMIVNNITGSPRSAHLYLVNKKPNNTTMPTGITNHDTTRYWGVFYSDGSNPSGNVNYYYNNNSYYSASGSCMIDLVKRKDNSGTSWATISASQNAMSLSKTAEPRSEFLLINRSNKFIHKDTGGVVCDGDSIMLAHTTSGLSYTWLKNGSPITGASTNAYQAKQNGTYQVIASLGSCRDTSNSYALTTRNKPAVSLAPLKSVCPDVQFDTLTGGSPAGGIYQHTFVSGNLFVVKSAGSGKHKITYKYTDQFGCSDTASQYKTVHQAPTVSVSSLNDMCIDSTAFGLSVGSPAGGVYFINGSPGNFFDPKVLGKGKHWIKYRYTDSKNCWNADSVSVNIKPLPSVVLNLFKDKVCEYTAAYVLDGQNPRGGSFTGSGVSGFNFNPATAGVGKHAITYTYKDKTTGCSNTATDSIEVNPRPAPPTITQVGDTLFGPQAESYQWYDKNGSIRNANDQKYGPKLKGNYKLVISRKGCSSTPSEEFFFNFSSLNSLEQIVGIKVYPNPANEELNIEFKNLIEPVDLKILNIQGAVVFKQNLNSSSSIDVSRLEAGTYVLQLSGLNQTYNQTLIVR